MNRCALVVVVGILTVALTASSTPNRQETVDQLQQAVSKTNIFELPSFVLRANVQINNQGKSVEGTYELLWNGPNQWREGISIPGYQEVKIGGKGTISFQRSTDHLPLRIYNLHEALGFSSEGTNWRARHTSSLVQLDLRDSDTIKKVGEKKLHGDNLTCWDIDDVLKTRSEFCISGTQGTLVRGTDFVDSDFQPVGNKIFPRSLSFQEEGKTVVAVSITELKTPAKFGAEAFQLPVGVSIHTGCMNPIPFRLIKRILPEYPQEARRQRIQGTVAMDASIAADGIPRIGARVEGSSSEFSDATIDAMKQWRYSPALCSGQPVEVETILRVAYELKAY